MAPGTTEILKTIRILWDIVSLSKGGVSREEERKNGAEGMK
jgi:hypothetical protein